LLLLNYNLMKRIFLLLATIFLTFKGYCQITFQKTFGGDNSFTHARQTTDGGYIIVGTAYYYGAGNDDVYLIKTDSLGDTLWTHTYGGTGEDIGLDVRLTTDGGYIIVGWTNGSFTGNGVYLIKINSVGDTLWSKTYGGPALMTDAGYEVQQTNDGGYVIIGNTNNYPSSGRSIYLIKTNAFGDTMLTKSYHASIYDDGYSIQQTNDGGFIIGGTTFNGITNLIYMIKLKSNFDTAWTKTYNDTLTIDSYNAYAYIQQTIDGGYIIAGGDQAVYMVKTDSIGNTLWSKTYDGSHNDEAQEVHQTTDGGYILVGSTNSFGGGQTDVLLIKTDSLGDTLWTRTFGGTGDDIGRSVQQTVDGGYIIGGFTSSFGTSSDIYIIKTDAEGNKSNPCYTYNASPIVASSITQVSIPNTIVSSGAVVTSPQTIIGGGDTVTTICFTTGIDEVKAMDNVPLLGNVYPNPFNDFTNVPYIIPLNCGSAEMAIFDVLGNKMDVYPLYNKGVNSILKISSKNYNEGVYFCFLIIDGKEKGWKKLVIIK